MDMCQDFYSWNEPPPKKNVQSLTSYFYGLAFDPAMFGYPLIVDETVAPNVIEIRSGKERSIKGNQATIDMLVDYLRRLQDESS